MPSTKRIVKGVIIFFLDEYDDYKDFVVAVYKGYTGS